MRRALPQPRFAQIELTDGQLWGVPSQQTYDPFDLHERGMAPHLAFASAKDPLAWHKAYGPLFGFTSAYSCTVQAFLGAQRRFVAVLNLWQAWKGDRKDIRECFLQAVAATGYGTWPGYGAVLGLNPEWEAEAKGQQPPPGELISAEETREWKTASGTVTEHRGVPPGYAEWAAKSQRGLYDSAEEFVSGASRKDLRRAAEDLLKHALAVRLEGIQPDFHDQAGFEATWVVRDFLQACYLMLFFDMSKRKGIRNCGGCEQFFYPTAKRARFCSTKCARKSRQRRYWKRRGKFLRRKRQEGNDHDL